MKEAPPSTAGRLATLREQLRLLQLDAFIIPQADEYLSEYLHESDHRLAFVSGFTGSAGQAIILRDRAALFVDGRYLIQAQSEVDPALFEVRHCQKPAPALWLAQQARTGWRIGVDPRLHSLAGLRMLDRALEPCGAVVVRCEVNPIDGLWRQRPVPPRGAVETYPLEYAGVPLQDKLMTLAQGLAGRSVQACVLTQLDSIAWLFNIRGSDLPHTPVVRAFAVVEATGHATLFLDMAKSSQALKTHLHPHVEMRPIGDFYTALLALGAGGAVVQIDPKSTNGHIAQSLVKAGARLVEAGDPVEVPRARKNAVELAGLAQAHLRDGVALARMLAWLDHVTQDPSAALPSELDVVAQIEQCRRLDPLYRGPSFDAIVGTGPHGAIVHYRPTPQTNHPLIRDTLLLIDSGGQYLCGTTDVTRTLVIGQPSAEMRRHATLVLKGHIALARQMFPLHATGAQLDAIARQFLWAQGLDYDHGTGHGVGCYLNVHEGPYRLSSSCALCLPEGAVLSVEPGLYLEGQYGIRHENLVVVEAAATAGFLQFMPLTLVPFDRRLIDPCLLSGPDLDWLNVYHRRVREALSPFLDDTETAWLRAATRPIG